MNSTFKKALAIGIVALGFGAGSAQATFIIGSITVADGIAAAGLPSPPSATAVSGLTGIMHDGFGNSSGCTSAFVGSCAPGNATMTNWLFAGGFPIIISINGFTFDLNGHGVITTTPLVCGTDTCSDSLTVTNLSGIVSKAGFDDTAFTGSLSLTGSCIGSGGVCTSDISGGYTYSLSATGRSSAPEPATLLLIGVALAGLGFARRKKA